jgi:acetyltransferase-like isoleucine patch superfamily enzyme
VTARCGAETASSDRHGNVIKRADDVHAQLPTSIVVKVRMAGEILSLEPDVDLTAKLTETRLGAYCEVGARTILLDVAMGDYSHVVNDAQITYTTIGKFCSIAAMTRINPRWPYHRAFPR